MKENRWRKGGGRCNNFYVLVSTIYDGINPILSSKDSKNIMALNRFEQEYPITNFLIQEGLYRAI